MWITERVRVSTSGDDEVVDLTEKVQGVIARHRLRHGQALVFVPGSTAGLTTMEFEPGLRHDVPAAFRRLVPREMPYRHEETWHDGNGHSHVRASLLGPSLTVPFADGKLVLGTWQQIVLIDFDVRPRQREIVVQLTGEKP
ncbi:MAG: secondary thiamine-phosphate synthase enzyme [Acidobacteria bacterium]|nr:MAG: secondary thiamine-phosphate synthase enzyme [Acidobacteriota bacterium]PYQ26229.1 MAG: secondary thiamine-phosphate synthase enzyme [Acidobacteriota bacterium]